jgi:glutamine synthetase
MRETLPKEVFERLLPTLTEGAPLDPSIADEVARGMKDWAVARGATHFTHWFQPLNGSTAEKHDAFLSMTGDSQPVLKLSGGQLVQGEPDASSFPSGGMRSTAEARGYTVWDPTSPAFLLRHERAATLCIPTIFLSWKGEALDRKWPLLKSIDELSKSACRVLKLLGKPAKRVYATMGTEQEYFLIDAKWADGRPDLHATGRTLLGAPPAKGQQLEDQYFGAIPDRVLGFMEEFEQTAWGLGIPVKTRHNEVAPHQYEIAPIFEDVNRAADHNQMLMEVMRKTARKRGLACLLHEKPFAGVNGSGKHNNWSMATDDGRNLLDPGRTPAENASFLLFCATVIQAVHRRADLLRAGIATAANDHRLGANEAPPAIVSVYLGASLSGIFEALAAKRAASIAPKATVDLGLDRLPLIAKDNTDRNRTSPFAFTGNKFEFRAVGSGQPIQMPNVFLNVAVAEALDEVAARLEKALESAPAGPKKGGRKADPTAAVLSLAGEVYKEARAVVFDGDTYAESWVKEAARRGLSNHRDAPAALEVYADPDAKKLLASRGIFQPHEMDARRHIELESFVKQVEIEVAMLARMVDTGVLPAALRQQKAFADSVASAAAGGAKVAEQKRALAAYSALVNDVVAKRESLSEAHAAVHAASHGPGGGDPAKHARVLCDRVRPAMAALRAACDLVEAKTDATSWPFPKYHNMLFQ